MHAAEQSREKINNARDAVIKQLTEDLNKEKAKQLEELVGQFAKAKEALEKERMGLLDKLRDVSDAAQREAKEAAQTKWLAVEKTGTTDIQSRRDSILTEFGRLIDKAKSDIEIALRDMPKEVHASRRSSMRWRNLNPSSTC